MKPSMEQADFLASLLLGLLYKPEDESEMFLEASVEFQRIIWCYIQKTEPFVTAVKTSHPI
jgi:hypothetical protein